MQLDVRTKSGSFQPTHVVVIITEWALIDRTPARSIADKAFSMLAALASQLTYESSYTALLRLLALTRCDAWKPNLQLAKEAVHDENDTILGILRRVVRGALSSVELMVVPTLVQFCRPGLDRLGASESSISRV
jgi:hypothetical protein